MPVFDTGIDTATGTAIDTPTLLAAWDAGQSQPPAAWALSMLALADPQAGGAEALARLSIGQRDARLLTCRNALFGRHLGLVDHCPTCRTAVELELDAESLRLPSASALPGEHLLMLEDGHRLEFRLPDSTDLAAAGAATDAAQALTVLVDRCVVRATGPAGESLRPAALPPSVVEALSARMAEIDAQAEVTLRMRCAACGHDWPVVFDVLHILWREVDAWCGRLLHEVHTLASAYGWAEAAIFATPAARRRRYLDLIAA